MSRTALFLGLSLVASLGCDRPTSPPGSSEAPARPSEPPPASATASALSATAPASALTPAPSAGPGGAEAIVFDSDATGGPASTFETVVGDWYVAEEVDARGFKVDGSKWRSGTPSANLADQAKRLYGERYAEFLDGVKAFAFYPLAIKKGEVPAGDLRVSVKFYPIAGKIDQAAGIAFGIAPDGSYLGARANALEDNILVFQVVKGKRTVFDTIRNTPTPTRTWHTFAVEVRGKHVRVELDGKMRFEKEYAVVRPGRVGLWSKADSQVLFDDFTVTPL
ncbi:MAG: hypothetical protein MUF34_11645 [Polyangiaceae bacterium]|jgi:hypothetical protein|nr:hypothetical protein [Polyangiaceae bacterium]